MRKLLQHLTFNLSSTRQVVAHRLAAPPCSVKALDLEWFGWLVVSCLMMSYDVSPFSPTAFRLTSHSTLSQLSIITRGGLSKNTFFATRLELSKFYGSRDWLGVFQIGTQAVIAQRLGLLFPDPFLYVSVLDLTLNITERNQHFKAKLLQDSQKLILI